MAIPPLFREKLPTLIVSSLLVLLHGEIPVLLPGTARGSLRSSPVLRLAHEGQADQRKLSLQLIQDMNSTSSYHTVLLPPFAIPGPWHQQR